jgi:Bacteriophage abortive infection AbiH
MTDDVQRDTKRIKALVIGNGYDLARGLKTSYRDFLESLEFKSLNEGPFSRWGNTEDPPITEYFCYKNGLAYWIANQQQHQNWVDIEHELIDYANLLNEPEKYPKSFFFDRQKKCSRPHAAIKAFIRHCKENLSNEFVDLKQQLAAYLKRISNSSDKTPKSIGHIKSMTLRFLKESESSKAQASQSDAFGFVFKNLSVVYSLNYTYFMNAMTTHKAVGHYVHGSLDGNDLVFGVHDGSVPEEFNFLLKSNHHAYGRVNMRGELVNADEVHFYGCSFGDTDDAHFEPLFRAWAATSDKAPRRILCFYVYGKDGYHSVRNRLVALTGSNLSGLRLNNSVHFFDTAANDGAGQYIDQAWLDGPAKEAGGL